MEISIPALKVYRELVSREARNLPLTASVGSLSECFEDVPDPQQRAELVMAAVAELVDLKLIAAKPCASPVLDSEIWGL